MRFPFVDQLNEIYRVCSMRERWDCLFAGMNWPLVYNNYSSVKLETSLNCVTANLVTLCSSLGPVWLLELL